jgi:hypothetical protein
LEWQIHNQGSRTLLSCYPTNLASCFLLQMVTLLPVIRLTLAPFEKHQPGDRDQEDHSLRPD